MIDRNHESSVSRQAQILNISRGARTSRRCRPTATHCQGSGRPQSVSRCAPSCPPRRSFVASGVRRRGQFRAVPTSHESTYH